MSQMRYIGIAMPNSAWFQSQTHGRKPVLTKYQRWRGAAPALNLSKPARLRLEWIIYYDQKQSATLTLRHFGLSSTGGKRYILTAVDHHSRLAFARMYSTKHARNAADFLKRLVILLDGQVKNIHIDNGTEFEAEFREAAESLKIGLYHARPYTPKDKPLVERFNGTLQQEFVNLGNFTPDAGLFNHELTEWLIFYNFVRPHHSLDLKRPAEFANMKAARVLPMWSPITQC